MARELLIFFGIISSPSVIFCFRAGCAEKAWRPGFLCCLIKCCYCASWGKCTKQCLGWLNECLSSRSVCVCMSYAFWAGLCVHAYVCLWVCKEKYSGVVWNTQSKSCHWNFRFHSCLCGACVPRCSAARTGAILLNFWWALMVWFVLRVQSW